MLNTLFAHNVLSLFLVEISLKEMEDLIVKLIFMLYLLLNVDLVMKLFEEIVLMLWDHNGIPNTLSVLIVPNHLVVAVSLNIMESPIVKPIIISKQVLYVLVVENQSLEDV